MTLALLLALLTVGFVLIGVELFITPGFVVGIVGMVFLGLGIWLTFEQYGVRVGGFTLTAVVLLLAFGIIFTLRSGFWNRVAHKDHIIGRANVSDTLKLTPGVRGLTISALRPLGTAIFDGVRFEVQSEGDFIDSQSEIEISSVRGTKILVKPINKTI